MLERQTREKERKDLRLLQEEQEQNRKHWDREREEVSEGGGQHTRVEVSTTQWRSAQHGGGQHNTVEVSTTGWRSAQHGGGQHNTVEVSTTRWRSAQHGGGQHNTVQVSSPNSMKE
ncbi:hypothetical protein EYF80_054924 [Liparis tanakae]|uniref:Uncharacterized protein n=1 Tax=Liparis tanakae TaxID=230148 RepID=A0A4Z2F2C2_9TELE|nr:hypothetical protein EYF80_054924 [Liparis tanakae]